MQRAWGEKWVIPSSSAWCSSVHLDFFFAIDLFCDEFMHVCNTLWSHSFFYLLLFSPPTPVLPPSLPFKFESPVMSFVLHLHCDHILVKPVAWMWSYWGQQPSLAICSAIGCSGQGDWMVLDPVSCRPYAGNCSYCEKHECHGHIMDRNQNFTDLFPIVCYFVCLFVCLTFSHPIFYNVLWALQGILWDKANHSTATCY